MNIQKTYILSYPVRNLVKRYKIKFMYIFQYVVFFRDVQPSELISDLITLSLGNVLYFCKK